MRVDDHMEILNLPKLSTDDDVMMLSGFRAQDYEVEDYISVQQLMPKWAKLRFKETVGWPFTILGLLVDL